MAFNGAGTFTRIHNFVTDRNNGIKIQAARMDAELDGFALGLSNTITRDGQSTVTAPIPFNGQRLINVGDATAATDAVNRQFADARYMPLSEQTFGLVASVAPAGQSAHYLLRDSNNGTPVTRGMLYWERGSGDVGIYRHNAASAVEGGILKLEATGARLMASDNATMWLTVDSKGRFTNATPTRFDAGVAIGYNETQITADAQRGYVFRSGLSNAYVYSYLSDLGTFTSEHVTPRKTVQSGTSMHANGGNIYVRGDANSSSSHLWLSRTDDSNGGLLYYEGPTNNVMLRRYVPYTNTISSQITLAPSAVNVTGSFSSTGAIVASGNSAISGGDFTACRSDNTSGVIFFGASGSRYLYYDGGNYVMPGANLYVNSGIVYHSQNAGSNSPTWLHCYATGTVSGGYVSSSGNIYAANNLTAANINAGSTIHASTTLMADNGLRSKYGNSGGYQANGFHFHWNGQAHMLVDDTYIANLSSAFSDYRLKTDVKDMTLDQALDQVMALRPVSYVYKDIEMFGDPEKRVRTGFIAHEANAAVPGAAVGAKDAVTKDGKIQPQSIDLYPIVTANTRAIQSLIKRGGHLKPQRSKFRFLEAMTDQQAIDFDALMKAQPLRKQLMFQASLYLDYAEAATKELHAALTSSTKFGKAAADLLLPGFTAA